MKYLRDICNRPKNFHFTFVAVFFFESVHEIRQLSYYYVVHFLQVKQFRKSAFYSHKFKFHSQILFGNLIHLNALEAVV